MAFPFTRGKLRAASPTLQAIATVITRIGRVTIVIGDPTGDFVPPLPSIEAASGHAASASGHG